jgi:hypothetical protein
VTGLASLQEVIQQLSSAYIKHTNAVLVEHGAGIDIENALARFDNNPLLGGLAGLRAPSPAKSDSGDKSGDKKKKARKAPDPFAPKRPLTPFFLYMQTARPIIAGDLGSEVAKGAVSEEGQQRWKAMDEESRLVSSHPNDALEMLLLIPHELWTNAYKDNLRLYTARTHSYKAGNQEAKEMTDEEAQAYYEEHLKDKAVEAAANGQLADEALAADAAAEDETPAEASAPTPKTPKTKAPRKKATPKSAAPAESSSAIVPPGKTATPVAAKDTPAEKEKEKSPEKKRKRKSKAADEKIVDSVEEEKELEKESEKTPAKKERRSRKKTKTDS